jgi:hypothetical protein
MSYVIKRTDQGGGFVSKPGGAKSYTKDMRQMRKYPTREAAETDRCQDNEIVVDFNHMLDSLRD